MKIKSEWEIIDLIRETVAPGGNKLPTGLVSGIGDDSAVFEIDKTGYGLITTDISIENIHFTKENINA